MSRDKSKDIRLLKVNSRVTDTRSVTMAYVLYEQEITRTNSEVTITSGIVPIVKNSPQGEDLLEERAQLGAAQSSNIFKKENKLICTVDLISHSIKFPHLNRYKVSKSYRGYGLSAYAMNEIAAILKESYPDFAIEPVHFSFTESEADVDRAAFFAFLEKFGFWFRFDGNDNNQGILNIERAEMLKIVPKKETITELEIAPFVKSLFDDRTTLNREISRIKTEFQEKNTVLNRFEKDQAITFLLNIIAALVLIILLMIFI